MQFDNIIKAMGIFGAGGSGSVTPGPGPRVLTWAGPGNAARPAFGAMSAVASAQAKADELASRTEETIRNPVVRAFLGIPSERPAPQWMKNVASAVDNVRLLDTPQDHAYGRQGWQALGAFGGRDRVKPPLIGDGLATSSAAPNLVEKRVPLLTSGIGGLAGAYHPPRTTTNAFDLPVLGGLGKLVRGYLGLAGRVDELMAGWRRPFEGFLKQAARRAWELYPRDSEGRPIPPWNLRLYFLAWAAYRLDDYAALARFLNEIDADKSPDNVLFVRDLLAPTFDPKRPDRRTDWWLLDPGEARRALRKRLKSIRSDGGVERRDGEISYLEDPEDDENPNDPYFYVAKRAPRAISAEGAFFDHELAALLLQELAAVLPPRQHEVVSLASRGWPYERIARHMGITVGAVKSHMHKVRNNPLVAEVLLPRPALRSGDAQIPRRTHRA